MRPVVVACVLLVAGCKADIGPITFACPDEQCPPEHDCVSGTCIPHMDMDAGPDDNMDCIGVICDAAPAPACLADGVTLRSFEPGICDDGRCTYDFIDTPCRRQCMDGRCTELYVFESFAYPDVAEPNLLAGFDLDGRASLGGERCDDTEDHASPLDPEILGVDNVMASEVEPLISLITSGGVNGALLDAIAAGETLLGVGLSNLDDREDDDEVLVHLYELALPPEAALDLDAESGLIVPDQAFVATEVGTTTGSIIDGRLRAALPVFRFTITLRGEAITLELRDAEVRADLFGGRLQRGVLGGAMDATNTIVLAVTVLGSGFQEMIMTQVREIADIDPNETGMECGALSAGLTFDAVTAFHAP